MDIEEKAEARGKAKGEAAVAISLSSISQDLDDVAISKITGLSLDEVIAIRCKTKSSNA